MSTFQTYAVRFAIPLAFIGIGILAARLGRKDGDPSPMKNTLCVGTSVILMSLSVLISDGILTVSAGTSTLAGGYWGFLIVFIVLIFYSVDNDRYGSWERDGNGKPTEEKNKWKGIIIPNSLAVLTFVGYQSYEEWW